MAREVFGGMSARIRNIPCIIRLDPDDWDERLEVYDRRGCPAPWLEARMSKEDLREALRALSEQISDAALNQAEEEAYARRYGW